METIMRSVQVIGDRIYTGSYKDFGYWIRNEFDQLVYHSLVSLLNVIPIENEEFWSIIQVDQWVVFQSLSRLYIYNPTESSIEIIESDQSIVNIFTTQNQKIYFQRINQGLYEIVNGKDQLTFQERPFRQNEVIGVFEEEGSPLIITKTNGFFTIKNEKAIPVSSELDQIPELGVYTVTKLSDGRYAIGTISHGLIILNNDFSIDIQFNQSNGLSNNTVLSILEDVDKNIWLGLDNGIAIVNTAAPMKVFTNNAGRIGSVYTTAIYKGDLYIGTNQGLFYRSMTSDAPFQFINNTQGQVWNLTVIDQSLFIGHHNGTFIIENKQAKKIADIPGTWSIKEQSSNQLIQGNYDGLYVLEKQNQDWSLRNKIEGFDYSARYFEVMGQTIFINHEYKGVFEIQVDEGFNTSQSFRVDSLMKGANSGLLKFQNNLLYASREGIFTYEWQTGKFNKDTLLSKAYKPSHYISGRMISEPDQKAFWIFSKNNLTRVSNGNLTSAPKFENIPITSKKRRNVVEYENIIPTERQNEYLIGTTYGYLTFRKNEVENESINDFEIYINSIILGINESHSFSNKRIPTEQKGNFDSKQNNLLFSFYTPEYSSVFEPTYQYRLTGRYNEWSEWSMESSVFFENIPAGNYTFDVRAKIGNKNSANTVSYAFSIAKPWYATNIMLAVYVLVIIGFSIFMHNVYKRHYKKQQERLIEENKRDLQLAKLQSEKELIKFKNDQLQKDYKDKSNELAASTMSIMKKNELLTQIKDQLKEVADKEVIKPVIRIIDKSLNQNENWELFKEAFDNADTEFFKNLKAKHPTLSPNDLKLCAYLRLNLSSKEVAQLINISPRSVEVKRYRLRKKLNLDSDENLTDYILSI